MPRLTKIARIREVEQSLDATQRYVDLAVRLRVLNEDGSVGDALPHILGGRWDNWEHRWVSPQPDDLQVIEWTIQEQQIPLLKDPGDVLFVALFAGRQAGKTYAAVLDLLLDAIRSPGRKFAIVSLDFKASRDPEEALVGLLANAPWYDERRDHNKTDRCYTLPHGAKIVFRSVEAINSVRGPSLKRILLDESAYMPHEAFVTAVGCGVAAKDFKLYLATTPKRENEWIRDVDRKWGKRKACRIHRLVSEENPRRNRELLAELIAQIPADLYDQEFKGKIVRPQDAVYYLYDPELHLRDLKLEVPRWQDCTRAFTLREFSVECDYVAGWDFGFEATVVGKIFRRSFDLTDDFGRNTRLYAEALQIVGEEVSDRVTTDHQAVRVRERFGTSIAIITDAMGAYDNSMGGKVASPKQLTLEEAGFAYVRPVATKNPDVDQRVLGVNRLLLNGKNETHLFVVPGAAPKLEAALENQRRGPNGKPITGRRGKTNAATGPGYEHPLDGLGYLCWMAFPLQGTLPPGFSRPFARKVAS